MHYSNYAFVSPIDAVRWRLLGQIMRKKEICPTFCFAKIMHAPLLQGSFKDGKAGAFEVDVFRRMERCVGTLVSGSRCHFSTGLDWIFAAVFLFLHSHTGNMSLTIFDADHSMCDKLQMDPMLLVIRLLLKRRRRGLPDYGSC